MLSTTIYLLKQKNKKIEVFCEFAMFCFDLPNFFLRKNKWVKQRAHENREC
jgi:hypothetical protein